MKIQRGGTCYDQGDDDTKEIENLAKRSLTDFQKSTSLDAINTVILLLQEALVLGPGTPLRQYAALSMLSNGLYARFHHSYKISDLDNAISSQKNAVKYCIQKDWQQSNIFQQLSIMFTARFDFTGNILDLERAFSQSVDVKGTENSSISLHRQPLELQAPERSLSFKNLANALMTQVNQGGLRGDLDEVILLCRQALELQASPHPNRFVFINDFANALWMRFQQRGQKDDLDEAISLYKQNFKLFPPSYHNRSDFNLSSALWIRFQQRGQQDDLDEVTSLHRQALELQATPHSNGFALPNDFINVLYIQFIEGNQKSNLDGVILLCKQVLLAPHNPNIYSALSNLVGVLWIRFEQENQQDDLDEIILFCRKALELQTLSYSNQFDNITNLANALLIRFKQRGWKGDLDEVVLLHRQVFKLQGPSFIPKSIYLDSFGIALATQFGHIDQQLDEAILLHRQALDLQAPFNYNRSHFINNLAVTLGIRSEQKGQQDDLHEAISLHRQALELQAAPHPSRYSTLNNLALALSSRFQQEAQQSDLDEAISLHKAALELQPLSHPHRSDSLDKLANLLMGADSLTNNDPSHLAYAMSLFSEAIQCPSQSPSQHFKIAKRWAYYADLHQHSSAIEAYDAALFILPQLAAFSLDIQSRQKALTAGSDGLARRAAKCAIRERRLDKAVEYLDTGRAIFWSQLVQLRSPVDQLYDLSPELADRLHNIAIALEHGSHRDTFSETLDNQKKISLEEEAFKLACLNKEWSKSIDEVRRLNGFEDFLQPSCLSSLQAAVAESLVVLLISNDDDSHCLIVTSKSVDCIALSTLSVAKLHNLIYLIQAAASQSKIWHSSIENFSHNTGTFPPAIQETLRNWLSLEEERGVRYASQICSDDIFRFVLKTIWDEVVKPVIDFLGLQVSLRTADIHQIYLQNFRNQRILLCCSGAQLACFLFFPSMQLVAMITG